MPSSFNMDPAHQLLGLTLPNTGWKIVTQLAQGATGGTFGTGYLAERPGPDGIETAFVKAISFASAMNSHDPMAAMRAMANLAKYESELAEYCTSKKMSRVIKSLGEDRIIPPRFNGDEMRQVFCIIFERGDGDLRKKLTTIASPSLAWKLAILRDVAQAIAQLHKGDLAHQDIKPSNVITMADIKGDPSSKLGDLGRAVRKSGGPYNHMDWPGANSYQPIERMYGHRPSDWRDEREASDAFLLAGLIMFIFTGAPMLQVLLHGIPSNLQPGPWTNGYDSTIKAAIVRSQSEMIENVLRPSLSGFANEICAITYEMTHPEPEKRGDRRARRQGQVGMDRIWSRLRLLAEKAKIHNL